MDYIEVWEIGKYYGPDNSKLHLGSYMKRWISWIS